MRTRPTSNAIQMRRNRSGKNCQDRAATAAGPRYCHLMDRSPDSHYTIFMHAHGHGPASTSKLLRVALILTLAYIAVTVIAGIKAHSLALLSEAGHNVSDFLALL